MTWRDDLRPASFRGVTFEARARDASGGRRIAHHLYPDRDQSYPEDMGSKPRAWSVEAYLLGPEYLTERDALVDALDTKGPGDYVDHWGKTWRAVARDWSYAENVGEGGYVQFRIDLVEYTRPDPHSVKADTRYGTAAAGGLAKASLLDDFAAVFDIRGPAALLDDALTLAGGVLDTVESVLAIPGKLVALVGSELAPVTSLLGRMRGGLAGLLGNPLGFANDLRSLFEGVLNLFPKGSARVGAARSLDKFDGDKVIEAAGGGAWPVAAGPKTPTRLQGEANRAAIGQLVHGLATVQAAVASADVEWPVYEDAVADRDTLAAALDAIAVTATADPVYRTTTRLRAAVVRDITTRGADLSRLSTVVPDVAEPALVLAFRLYGDAGRDAEIVARNRAIRHPGFVPAGAVLKVLTDG